MFIECAEALVNIFCRVSVPREMLSDRGSQFVSDLMREISHLLSVRQLHTTPYHVQCNRLVEQFNSTIPRMLQKMVAEKPSDWDRYTQALLFSYREVPLENLGLSPFDLVYERSVRGPMSVLRDIWVNEDTQEQTRTIYQYVHDELRKAQSMQHKWFNRSVKIKNLKVLLLLPIKMKKLEMQ